MKRALPILLLVVVVALAVPLAVLAQRGHPPQDGQPPQDGHPPQDGQPPQDGEPSRFGGAYGAGWMGGGTSLVDATAEATGLSVEAVVEALQEGQSYADIAADAGVDPQAIVDVFVAAREAALAEAVEEGRISQEQVDLMLEEMSEHLLDRLDEVWSPRGPGYRFNEDFEGDEGRPFGGGRMFGRRGGGSRRGFGSGPMQNFNRGGCPYAEPEA